MSDASDRLARVILSLHAAGKDAGAIVAEVRTRNFTDRHGRLIGKAAVEGFLRIAEAMPTPPAPPAVVTLAPGGRDPSLTGYSAIAEMMSMPRDQRPSVVVMAKAVLEQDMRLGESGHFFLRENGRWSAAVSLHAVMRAANRVLKERGEPQILTNPAWGVK